MAAASWDNAKIVLADGSTAYHMCDGVGQGCPAAAALFVIGIDPLLVALGKITDAADGETLSAYADDIPMILAALERMGVVHAIFAKYKLAAALALICFKDSVCAARLQLPVPCRRRNSQRSHRIALA